ncbi:MAG TPA: cupin domain-containing protein [Gemmatimonadales bacterium]|nr:cupin domain-containing protein [Gemmatimonadales bacterium]
MDRARALVAQLELAPHPEGGFYREIFRSPERVVAERHGAGRDALTVIHFLLPAGAHSAVHRVTADEAWHFVEGDPLELVWVTEADEWRAVRLGALADGDVPAAVVPAGAWQACRPLGRYTLVACDVAPGFQFDDFALLRDDPTLCAALVARHPALAALI